MTDEGYNREKVASYLGIREDDLVALLPDTAIAVEALLFHHFTDADVLLLEQLIRDIRDFAAESVYGGSEL